MVLSLQAVVLGAPDCEGRGPGERGWGLRAPSGSDNPQGAGAADCPFSEGWEGGEQTQVRLCVPEASQSPVLHLDLNHSVIHFSPTQPV